MMRIVISTGGTGGHIFPALQTALALRNRSHDVIFVGALGVGQEKVKSQGFDVVNIPAQGFTKKSIAGVVSLSIVTLQAIFKANSILKELRPNKVIGFGGYGSFAVVLAAWILKIPVMIHEQNVFPGKANRLLAKLVKKVAISFKDTQKYLPEEKTVWTGCPCLKDKSAESKEVLYQKFKLDSAKKTVLVLGGSQGSQRINAVVFEMISAMRDSSAVQFILMTGKKEFPEYLAKYKNVSVTVRVFDFISPIQEVYAISDLVIARSGAATVSELGHFVLPSILIPYPLADAHQKYNAQALFDVGLAQIIEQSVLTADLLQLNLESMLGSGFDQQQFKIRLKNVFKDDPALELALTVENL